MNIIWHADRGRHQNSQVHGKRRSNLSEIHETAAGANWSQLDAAEPTAAVPRTAHSYDGYRVTPALEPQ
jgi:hypothetical protein